MEVALTKMSSKGQVVIPAGMRKGFKQGEKLLLIQSDGQLILKKASSLDKSLKEDIDFARRTQEAWNRYKKGEFKSMPADKFIALLKKC